MHLGRNHKGGRAGVLARLTFWGFLLGLALVTMAPLLPDARAANSPDVNRLLQIAAQKQLHLDHYWWILLHYKTNLLGRTESFIDAPEFFLAENGKYDPQAELQATIRALFGNSRAKAEAVICRFIARYTWLKSVLPVPADDNLSSVCEKINRIHPTSATLVFPSYLMNSPASMFGHTLININTRYDNKLLSRAVNYSAFTDETNGLFFAVKGLFGFYQGYYSVLPYYKKIQEYSDMNQRDIWEYNLNLTPAELKRMVLHIRELENVGTDYYFFDENCSFNLLFLLEAARPSVNLVKQFPFVVLPVDTIKAIQGAGLIDSVDFRPSKATTIKDKLTFLSTDLHTLALDIFNGRKPPESVFDLTVSPEMKIRVIDLLVDYLQYRYGRRKLEKSDYQREIVAALKVRAKLGKTEKPLYAIPHPPLPESVHDSYRLSMGMGVDDDHFFQEIAIRPAFSDLLDTDYYGYEQGAQIEFCNTKLRHYPSNNNLTLNTLDLVSIVSLSPRNAFFKPYAWKVNTGLKRLALPTKEKETPRFLVYQLNTGAGLAYFNRLTGLSYIFLEPELLISGRLKEGYTLGAGVSVGCLKKLTAIWKLHAYARLMAFKVGDSFETNDVGLSQNLRISRNTSIHLDCRYHRTEDDDYFESTGAWYLFF